ncbi:met8p [Saccharomyces arboricola H-6]|uniref:precorrin-2 dehydrogenase n=1 Tax=Saccharomyces arboricola (strain H-6 / AS 2.3317 / CBS 10644) TaxID=1160507 RepID=J8PRC4_SACAR|nr:met8p [Saccharomyces arboricola H-6]
MVKSLQLAHQLKGKRILLIGGGEVGLTRLQKLLPTGCKLTLVSVDLHKAIVPKFGKFIENEVHPEYRDNGKRIVNPNWDFSKNEIYEYINGEFKDEYLDLDDEDAAWHIILTCIPDHPESARIYHLCKEKFGRQQLVNVADKPELCDFYFGANLEISDRLQILISTNGLSPRFGALVRDEIRNLFAQMGDLALEDAVVKLGELRSGIRLLAPDDKDVKYRMSWAKRCTDLFGIQHCHNIDVERLLGLFKTMFKDQNCSLQFPPKEQLHSDYCSS